MLTNVIQYNRTVSVREHQIKQHAGRPLCKATDGLGLRGDARRLKSPELEQLRKRPPAGGVVFDDQHAQFALNDLLLFCG